MLFGADTATTLLPDTEYTFWDSQTGGAQITTLTFAATGKPTPHVKTHADGRPALFNETTGTHTYLWADSGNGTARAKVYADPSGAYAPIVNGAYVAGRIGAGTAGRTIPGDFAARGYQTKLAAAATTLVRAALVGDSVGRGYYASSLHTKGWFAVATAVLQARYGDGGSGWHGAADTVLLATSVGVNATARTAYLANGDYWTVTGSWTAVAPATNNGPGGCAVQTTVPGDSFVIPNMRGKNLRAFTYGNGGSNATYTWAFKDGSGTTLASGTVTDTATAATVQAAALPLPAVSSGSLTITHADTNGKTLRFFGAEAVNPTGVVGLNYSVYGQTAQLWSAESGSAAAALGTGKWSGGSLNPADLVIYEDYLNTMNSSFTLTTELSANAAAGNNTLTLTNYVPPGRYNISNGTNSETIVISHVVPIYPTTVGSATPMTYTANLDGTGLANAYTTGNAVFTTPRYTADQWAMHARSYLADAVDGNAGATDVMIVAPHVGKFETAASQAATNDGFGQAQDYHDRALGLANQFGAAFVDFWAAGHNSWTWMSNSGFWSNPAVPGAAGADSVHPGDAGQAWMAGVVVPVLEVV